MTITYDFGDPAYFLEPDLRGELDRVFDLCHGCRLCWNLCPSFGSLFDLIDAKTDGLDVRLDPTDQDRIVDECYQCKLCYIKCPYVPPHQWELDFPRLMLRALATRTGGKAKGFGEKVLASTTVTGRIGTATVPMSNKALKPCGLARTALEKAFGISKRRLMPSFNREQFSQWWLRIGSTEKAKPFEVREPLDPTPGAVPSFLEPSEDELIAMPVSHAPRSAGPNIDAEHIPSRKANVGRRVALFPTCMVEYQDSSPGKAAVRVLSHNGCDVQCTRGDRCCGMPSLDAGDTTAFVQKAKRNVAELAPHVEQGRTIIVVEPTCNYVMRREYPHYLAGDDATAVGDAVMNPAEYLLALRTAEGIVEEFDVELGRIVYHAACHLRAQQHGYKARELLQLIPGTTVEVVEGCTGIDGTWGYRAENYGLAKRVLEPTTRDICELHGDLLVGDCLLANVAISEEGMVRPIHPMQALARAYGLRED